MADVADPGDYDDEVLDGGGDEPRNQSINYADMAAMLNELWTMQGWSVEVDTDPRDAVGMNTHLHRQRLTSLLLSYEANLPISDLIKAITIISVAASASVNRKRFEVALESVSGPNVTPNSMLASACLGFSSPTGFVCLITRVNSWC